MRRLEAVEMDTSNTDKSLHGAYGIADPVVSFEDRLISLEVQGARAIAAQNEPIIVRAEYEEGDDDNAIVIKPVIFLTLAVTSGTVSDTGDATTKCGYEYDVSDAFTGYKYAGDGTDPAVAAADPIAGVHEWVRPEVGYMNAATFGYGHLNSTGALVIGWINEIAEQEACGGEEGNTYDQGSY